MSDLLEPWETDGPARAIQRKVRERDVQKRSVDWWRAECKRRGRIGWARKFSSPSQRSVPDYLFSVSPGVQPQDEHIFAVEFKAPGKKSSAAQMEEQDAMRLAGWDVYEVDSFEKFKEIARWYL